LVNRIKPKSATHLGQTFPSRVPATFQTPKRASSLLLKGISFSAPLRNMLRRTPFPLLLLVALTGCAAGTRFHEPKLPKGATYILPSPSPRPFIPGGATRDDQKLDFGGNLPGQWWQLFRSPELSALVRAALKQNPGLKSAQAALNQSQELFFASESNLLPKIDGGTQAQREKINAASLGLPNVRPTFSVVTGALSTSYAPDVWGGIRREIQLSGAQVDYQRFELEETYLSLTSKVVDAAISIAATRAQIAITQKVITDETNELAIIRHQFLIGGASRLDVLQQDTSLAIARAKLPPLIKQLTQSRNQLAALTGVYPNNITNADFSLKTLHLPVRLPISLPSKLIVQRPDVRAAQALLHAACAKLGIAVANQLPQLTISASLGNTADGFTNLFSSVTGVWTIMGGISQTLFDAGALQDKKRAASDDVRKASEQYRSIVIAAFQKTSDALRAVQIDASTFHAQRDAEKKAAQGYSLSKERFLAGAINYLTLLTTDRTWQNTKLALTKDRATRLSDTVALFQALGGGWWNRQDLAAPPERSPALTIPIISAFQR
jgi:NodT family efflux transporter outer membrane factor (OMF) lipoprotein